MPDFVLDVCMDVVEGQKGYVTSFFRDIFRLNGWVLVIGGSTMNHQMQKKEPLMSIINQLKDANRLRVADKSAVDCEEKAIRRRVREHFDVPPPECDDYHILALCSVDGCTNVLTRDHRLRICVDRIRHELGHGICPNVRVISNEETYLKLKNRGQL